MQAGMPPSRSVAAGRKACFGPGVGGPVAWHVMAWHGTARLGLVDDGVEGEGGAPPAEGRGQRRARGERGTGHEWHPGWRLACCFAAMLDPASDLPVADPFYAQPLRPEGQSYSTLLDAMWRRRPNLILVPARQSPN